MIEEAFDYLGLSRSRSSDYRQPASRPFAGHDLYAMTKPPEKRAPATTRIRTKRMSQSPEGPTVPQNPTFTTTEIPIVPEPLSSPVF